MREVRSATFRRSEGPTLRRFPFLGVSRAVISSPTACTLVARSSWRRTQKLTWSHTWLPTWLCETPCIHCTLLSGCKKMAPCQLDHSSCAAFTTSLVLPLADTQCAPAAPLGSWPVEWRLLSSRQWSIGHQTHFSPTFGNTLQCLPGWFSTLVAALNSSRACLFFFPLLLHCSPPLYCEFYLVSFSFYSCPCPPLHLDFQLLFYPHSSSFHPLEPLSSHPHIITFIFC